MGGGKRGEAWKAAKKGRAEQRVALGQVPVVNLLQNRKSRPRLCGLLTGQWSQVAGGVTNTTMGRCQLGVCGLPAVFIIKNNINFNCVYYFPHILAFSQQPGQRRSRRKERLA